MKASKLDLMKLALTFDGEFCLSDFSPEEIDEMLGFAEDETLTVEQIRERYFEFYDDIKDRTLNKHKWSD
ncbi:MAG: hypothetical protein J6B04_00820 [Clostridia bacterium]|nr:hypothetical protein [Clostridia bacterium]